MRRANYLILHPLRLRQIFPNVPSVILRADFAGPLFKPAEDLNTSLIRILVGDTRPQRLHVVGDILLAVNSEEDVTELVRESDVTFIEEVNQVDGKQVYHQYTKNAPNSVVPEFESEEEVIEWFEKQFTTDEQQAINNVIKISDEILTEKEEGGHSFSTYKQMDLEVVPTVLNQVEWRQQVPEVAAELLSHFILAHSMPNTNHRTAIVLVDRYLTSIDENFNMPDAGEENQWNSWAADVAAPVPGQ
ncbi:hypothetical protein [Natronococcus jeotgali]|uniref:hypothetical protein n=1 Tax=Natronococcus jeotgali TaxID=413812 RepID=UPI0014614707|nr:hypothetical protein [Natronococcus jeotgali]